MKCLVSTIDDRPQLDDPIEVGPLLQGVEVAVRAFMAGAVALGMFF